LAFSSSPKKTRKQGQAANFPTPVKAAELIKKSSSPTKIQATPKWLGKHLQLRKPCKPVFKAWPKNQLKAFDMPGGMGWGTLMKHTMRSRGWTVGSPCASREPHEHEVHNSQLVFAAEFEAMVRGMTPEQLVGKKNVVQDTEFEHMGIKGYRLKQRPRPRHALWMMNWAPFRVPGTYGGRCMPREDFNHILVKYGHLLPGQPGDHLIAGIPGLDTAVSKDRMSVALRGEPWYPYAYVMPQESNELLKRLGDASGNQYWIAKPRNECAGAGIAVWHGADPEFAKIVKAEGQGTKRSVVQSYLPYPLLIGGHKFHMRIHLVMFANPLQAFVWRGGQCLFSTKPYTLSKKTLGRDFDPPVHVTNQGLDATPANKENYCREKPVIGKGQQISMKELEKYLAEAYPGFDLDAYWGQINHICANTVKYISTASSVRQYGKLAPHRHFELMGIDLMVDKDLKIYMCEINGSPGVDYPDKLVLGDPNPDYDKERIFATQTFQDMLTLMGLDAENPQSKGSLNNWYELDFSGHEGTSLAN